MNELQLPSGLSYCTLDDGTQYCTGAQLGRGLSLYPYRNADIKLRLQLLPMCGDYDKWNAYWGSGPGIGRMYVAWNEELNTYIFMREWSRAGAKKTIRNAFYPNARFY
jgi:hypothetical protein